MPHDEAFVSAQEEYALGFEAEGDEPGRQRALTAFLAYDDLVLTDLTDEERAALTGLLEHAPLRSVTASDARRLGDPAAEGWHTAASGRQARPCWWARRQPFAELLAVVAARRETEAS